MFYSPEKLQINPLWFEEIPLPCELRLLDKQRINGLKHY